MRSTSSAFRFLRPAVAAAALHAWPLIAGCVAPAAEEAGTSRAAVTSATLKYTSECEGQIKAADRGLFEEAFALLDLYQFAVEDHVNGSIAAGNPYSYTVIYGNRMDDWRGEIDEMALGDIKIACEYNATTDKCAADSGELAWTVNEPDWYTALHDRVHLCVDNIRKAASNGSAPALTAGVIAHELMHHVDGGAGHGADGKTNPQDPDTSAETIGVALEHLVLTPDLRAKIKAVTSTFSDDDHHVAVEIKVENLNSRAKIGLFALSEQEPADAATILSLRVNGVKVDEVTVDALDALARTTKTLTATLPGEYDPNTDSDYDLQVVADATDVHSERDELNNADNTTFSTAVDLRLSVDLAGAPICHRMEWRKDVDPPGYYYWLEIPYRAKVRNVHPSTPAPASDVVMQYDDMFRPGRSAQKVVWIPSLAPGEATNVSFSLDVPTDLACSGPFGATDVAFIADGNALTVFDVDRGNNAVELVIDAAYWKPNYVVNVQSPGQDERLAGQPVVAVVNGATTFSVKNVGPVAAAAGPGAPVSRTRVLHPDGSSVFSAIIPALAPVATQTFQVMLSPAACDALTYTIVADATRAVAESQEGDNRTDVTLLPSLAQCASSGVGLSAACQSICANDRPCDTPCYDDGAITTCQEAGDCPGRVQVQDHDLGPFDEDDAAAPRDEWENDLILDEMDPLPR